MTTGSEMPASPPSTSARLNRSDFGQESIGSKNIDPAIDPEDAMDESTRKRLAIGLSPRRATAPIAPARPPAEVDPGRLRAWTLVGLVAAIAVATVLLVLARIAGAPTDWPTAAARLVDWPVTQTQSTGIASLTGSGRSSAGVSMTYDFTQDDASMPQSSRENAYAMGHLAQAGVYRLQVWPDQVAWVVPGPVCPSPYRLVANAIIDPAAPDGHVGLFGRYQQAGNFYLFTVDGFGNYAVLLLQDGVWQTVQTGTHDSIRRAGERNTLVLGDDGETMLFIVNGEPLYEMDAPQLSPGKAGFGGRAGEYMAQIDFTGVELTTACQ